MLRVQDGVGRWAGAFAADGLLSVLVTLVSEPSLQHTKPNILVAFLSALDQMVPENPCCLWGPDRG